MQWLTAALDAGLEPWVPGTALPPEPNHPLAALAAFPLTQQRHRLRGELGWPRDGYDNLADQLHASVGASGEEDAEQYDVTMMLFGRPWSLIGCWRSGRGVRAELG